MLIISYFLVLYRKMVMSRKRVDPDIVFETCQPLIVYRQSIDENAKLVFTFLVNSLSIKPGFIDMVRFTCYRYYLMPGFSIFTGKVEFKGGRGCDKVVVFLHDSLKFMVFDWQIDVDGRPCKAFL